MKIHRESIHHYLAWMREGQHFAFAGFSDAEWYCILGQREDQRTGLGQIISKQHGLLLANVLKRRWLDPWFLFAVPDCLRDWPGFAEGEIDWWLGKNDIRIEGYERDRVTDDLAREAGLHPLIRQLQDMDVVLIGPKELEVTEHFLRFRRHVMIETPNLHMRGDGIIETVERVLNGAKPAVYLISAGVSAAVIIDQLYDNIKDSWFIDCGSIWDAFAGIGGQRQWRAKLYADPEAYRRWLIDNIEGKHAPSDGRYRWLRYYPQLPS